MTADLGRLGESVLQQWAAQSGLIANRSVDHDAAGWDCLVEWPYADTSVGANFGDPSADPVPVFALPLDRRAAPLQCFVQVKTTARRVSRWDVKLTNWLRFVHAPLPCFFLILEVNGAQVPQRGFLVHMGTEQVRAVLKRLREIEVWAAGRNEAVALRKHQLPVTWTPDDALSALHGAAFKARVEAIVGSDLEAYRRAKASAAQTAGYETGTRRVDAIIRPSDGWRGDPRDLLLDFQLGLVPQLEVREAEVFDTRFDIPIRDPAQSPGGGWIQTPGIAPVGRAQARFLVPGTPDELRLELDARVVTGVVTGAAGDGSGTPRVKARFSAPFVDFVLDPGGMRMDVHPTLPSIDDAQPLAALAAAARLFGLLDTAHRTATPVTAEFRIEGALLGTGQIAQTAPLPRPLAEWSELVRYAWAAAKDADLPGDTAVTVRDLARSRGPLQVIAAVLRPLTTPLMAEVSIPDPVAEPERLWCFPITAEAKIGAYVVQVGAAMFGHPTRIPPTAGGRPRYRLESTDVRVVERRVYREPEVPERTTGELQRDVGAAYADAMNVVLVTTNDDAMLAFAFTPLSG